MFSATNTKYQSYQMWLAEQGIISAGENTLPELRQLACINYFFKSKPDAENFIKRFDIINEVTEKKFIPFVDSATNLDGVLIYPKKLESIKEEYRKQNPQTNLKKINEQITDLKALAQSSRLESKEFETLNKLAKNQIDDGTGAIASTVTDILYFALQCYLRINRELLSDDEVQTLQTFPHREISDDTNFTDGLKFYNLDQNVNANYYKEDIYKQILPVVEQEALRHGNRI